MKFIDWLVQKESSAFTRLRKDAASGLKPPISPAAVHSRSTASPFEASKLGKKKKKKFKKKEQNLDSWLKEVGDLEKEVLTLNKSKEKSKKTTGKCSKKKPNENPAAQKNTK